MRRPSHLSPEQTERLFKPLEPEPGRVTLWQRQAHRWQTQSHDPATCPLCPPSCSPEGKAP